LNAIHGQADKTHKVESVKVWILIRSRASLKDESLHDQYAIVNPNKAPAYTTKSVKSVCCKLQKDKEIKDAVLSHPSFNHIRFHRFFSEEEKYDKTPSTFES
jgi:hypothetical protein